MSETRIELTRMWGNGWRITLAGEIARWDALCLEEELLDTCEEGAAVIVVDLTGVTRLDHIGLAALIGAAEQQSAAGHELFLAARDRSRLGYRVRPLSASRLEQVAGLHPALDRAITRQLKRDPGRARGLDAGLRAAG